MTLRRTSLVLCYAASIAAVTGNESPTYHRDIAPLIDRHCLDCHGREGVAPINLEGYENVRRRASLIRDVVASGLMPPWKPDSGYGPALLHERKVAPDEIARIDAWVTAGALQGQPTDATAPRPRPKGWALGEPDLILTLPETYRLAAEGRDVFHNFVLPIPIAALRYVRAVEFRPGSRGVIHHATFALDETPASRQRDAAEPGPGFSSMDLGRARNPTGHIIGWTPGQGPYEAYPGTAWELRPGTDLVMQLHLLPSGKPEPVSPQVGLYFTEAPPTRHSVVIQLRSHRIDIPAGEAAYAVEETFRLPVDARVISVYPHAHYVARDIRIDAELPEGRHLGLLRIPDWDFNWQGDYRFADPPRLPAGTRLHMRYVYDNSSGNPRNPFSPPQRIRGGWSSFDEMGEVAIQLLLDTPAERLRVDEAQARYELASGAASATAWYNLAIALDYQERSEEAVRAYGESLKLDPALTQALNNLGVLRERTGFADHAAELYLRSARSDPHFAPARTNLARIALLKSTVDRSEAISLLRGYLALRPDALDVRIALADLEAAEGRIDAALSALEEGGQVALEDGSVLVRVAKLHALKGNPARAHALLAASVADGRSHSETFSRAEAHYVLALLAQQRDDWPSVARELSAAVEHDPGHVNAHLMSATLAIAMSDPARARSHLGALLRPDSRIEPTLEKILRVLPVPEGLAPLAEALIANGHHHEAAQFLPDAIQHLRSIGKHAEAQRLEAHARTPPIP